MAIERIVRLRPAPGPGPDARRTIGALTRATLLAAAVAWSALGHASETRHSPPPLSAQRAAPRHLPPGSEELPIENLEGVVLVRATLYGPSGRDTSGLLVVDTGAGFLGLDDGVAHDLGLTDAATKSSPLTLASNAVSRLELGGIQIDHVSPVIVLDADVIQRVTGRSVLGLMGQRVFAGRALWIDYAGGRLICMPSAPDATASDDDAGDAPVAPDSTPAQARLDAMTRRSRELLAPLLSPAAQAIPFRLAGDHKILVRARFRERASKDSSAWLTLVFDTGATKSVLFEPGLSRDHPGSSRWRSVRGLVAPTLVGSPAARLTMAPAIELLTADARRPLRRNDVDCAVIETDLAAALSDAIGAPVSGLIGYSFFKGFRLGIDYTNRVLWLDPDGRRRDAHPFEYSHVGLQLERHGERVRVLGVAVGSPADSAGIAVGDTLVAVGLRRADVDQLMQLTDLLEGPPGTRVRITLRRDGVERSYRLVRRRLL